MTALLADRTLLGCEEPRLFTAPLRELMPDTTRGYEVIAFAEDVLGMRLTPWQKWLYIHALELLPSGRYRFRTLLILIARQNGKTTWLQILALWALYVDGAQLVLGTAQNLDVAEECWQGSVDMAEGVAELAAEIAAVDRTNGKKALRLQSGQRYKVQAANRRGGRGLSGDLVVLDELREHQSWDAWGAITKTTMAKKDALVVGLSNAGDDSSVVLNHLRMLALDAIATPEADTSLGLFEWSAPDGCELDDRDGWAQANPSVGHTDLTEEAIRSARETDPAVVFRTEVLCQKVDTTANDLALPLDRWTAGAEPGSQIIGSPSFAIAVSLDRSCASIGAFGVNDDENGHVELVQNGNGTGWIVARMASLANKWGVYEVALDGAGPAASLIPELEEEGLTVRILGTADVTAACASMYDALVADDIKHLDDPRLNAAVAGAKRRAIGDRWGYGRKASSADITPIEAVTFARHAYDSTGDPGVWFV